jgi:TonB family protein
MRGLGAAVALSALAHGGAVVTVGALGTLWLAGSMPAPPAALYVDLVEPVRATTERSAASGAPPSRSRRGDPGSARPATPARVPPTPASVPERPDAPAPGARESTTPPSESVVEAPEIARPPVAPEPRPAPPRAAPAPPRDVAPPAVAAAPAPRPAPAPAPLLPPGEATVSVSTPPPSAPLGPASGEPQGAGTASSSRGVAEGLGVPSGTSPAAAPSGGQTQASPGGGASDVAGLVPGDARPSGAGEGRPRAGGIPPEYDEYVRALRQRVQDRLVYPPAAARRGQHGIVELEVRVGAEGRLVGVEVVAGPRVDTLRTAAVTAVRGAAPFPFPPGVVGRPLVIRLPVEFQLR